MGTHDTGESAAWGRYVAALHEVLRAQAAYYGAQRGEPWYMDSAAEMLERAADHELDSLEGTTPREREIAGE